jgi:hypothetical protein
MEESARVDDWWRKTGSTHKTRLKNTDKRQEKKQNNLHWRNANEGYRFSQHDHFTH